MSSAAVVIGALTVNNNISGNNTALRIKFLFKGEACPVWINVASLSLLLLCTAYFPAYCGIFVYKNSKVLHSYLAVPLLCSASFKYLQKYFMKSQFLQVPHNYASILKKSYFKLTSVCPHDLDKSENNMATNPSIPTRGQTMLVGCIVVLRPR